MVLETTWQTPTGWMTVHDLLAMGPTQGARRRSGYRRAPSDFGAVGALVRIATCVSGYRVEGTDTGFSGEEGTFTICSFWLVSALTMIGEIERARALAQKLLSFAGPLHLYAEEIDTSTGQHLGNFPQAFTHLALIEALSLLIESESENHFGDGS
jgi:GH15 family glucan-1,4-alpha-glucosidase